MGLPRKTLHLNESTFVDILLHMKLTWFKDQKWIYICRVHVKLALWPHSLVPKIRQMFRRKSMLRRDHYKVGVGEYHDYSRFTIWVIDLGKIRNFVGPDRTHRLGSRPVSKKIGSVLHSWNLELVDTGSLSTNQYDIGTNREIGPLETAIKFRCILFVGRD